MRFPLAVAAGLLVAGAAAVPASAEAPEGACAAGTAARTVPRRAP
ncbi:hypothetical protein ACFMQL_16185 [Nonomuraea fastidiosa]